MAEYNPYGASATADALSQAPAPAFNPFAPAGMNEATRTGFGFGLQGQAGAHGVAQQHAQDYGNYGNAVNQFVEGLMGSPAPTFQRRGGGGSGLGVGGSNYYDQAMGYAGDATAPGNFNTGFDMTRGAYDQATPGMQGAAAMTGGLYNSMMPGFGLAANMAQQTAGQYGGGYDPGIARLVNETGSSFDPFNNPALADSISGANSQLARQFSQSVMPELNRSAVAAGPGAYGGTRAGVAQGMREQSLADAMAKQTGDMMSQGYETGLNRYVQDRANTVSNTVQAGRTGADVGLGAAGQLADLLGTQGQLGLQSAGQIGNLYNQIGGNRMAQGAQMGNLASQLGGLNMQGGQLAGNIGNALTGANASMSNAATSAGASMYGADTTRYLGDLGQHNDMLRFGLGSLMPQYMQGNLDAQSMPYDIQQQMGQSMMNFGQAQTGYDQNRIDHGNQLANYYGEYPNTQQQGYINNALNIAGQSPSGPQTSMQSQSPWATGLGAASLAYGMYENGAFDGIGGGGSSSGIGSTNAMGGGGNFGTGLPY